jgi:hypothetical protein
LAEGKSKVGEGLVGFDEVENERRLQIEVE